jgi:microcin C transport system substrate-binding protein
LLYPQKDAEKYLTILQEDLRKVGISLNLRLVTFETLVKLIDERQFGMVSLAYSADLFPNPETQLLSSLADQDNTNNITGFKNKRVDQLIEQYDTAYEIPQRVKILQEVDNLFTDAHHWMFEWYAPYSRVVFWNKFAFPKGHFTRIGDFTDMVGLWWLDPDKIQKLDQARRNPSMKLDQDPVDDKYWLDFSQAENQVQLEKAPNSK